MGHDESVPRSGSADQAAGRVLDSDILREQLQVGEEEIKAYSPETLEPDEVTPPAVDLLVGFAKQISELESQGPVKLCVNYPPPKGSGLVNRRSLLHSVYYKPIDTWLVPQQLAVEEATGVLHF